MSVIVPVFDPGETFDECVASLLGQTMPAGELELIFVDDGSTDGTAQRLDALAAAHAHVRVEHIPNSGWPGRPRNLGMEMARGEFVYFVDNDDWLERDAVERLHAAAVEDAADIVIGKVVGHGKRVPRELFRESVRGSAFTPKLLALLTPHKLFRRAMLEANGIRFPEGRVRLEDHLFVVHAYFHARAISVLADRPYYHWALRPDPTAQRLVPRLEPEGYFANVRDVLDLVDAHTEPGPFRDALRATGTGARCSGASRAASPGATTTTRGRCSTRSAGSRWTATTRACTSGSRSTCGCAPRCCGAATPRRCARSPASRTA